MNKEDSGYIREKINDQIAKSISYVYYKSNGKNTRLKHDKYQDSNRAERTFNDYNVFETKGTWQMNNDFMSGPFINYAIKDKANNRSDTINSPDIILIR